MASSVIEFRDVPSRLVGYIAEVMLRLSQVVRHRCLVPALPGSNPGASASFPSMGDELIKRQPIEDSVEGFQPEFGSKEIKDSYAQFKASSVSNGIPKLYDFETTEDEARLFICNTYLITKNLHSLDVMVFERDWRTGEWCKCRTPPPIFNTIPVWPVLELSGVFTSQFKKAILERLNEEAEAAKLEQHSCSSSIGFVKPLISRVKAYFTSRLFGQIDPTPQNKDDSTFEAPQLYVSSRSARNAMKGIRAAFHRHFREPELFRAILSMNHQHMTLSDYVYYAEARADVLKVWIERRNLIPMLPYIDRVHWGDDNLFSSATWTDFDGLLSEVSFTLGQVDYLPSRPVSLGSFEPLPSIKAFNWLSRSKNTVVKAWLRAHKDNRVAAMMADLNVPSETPTIIVRKTVTEMAARIEYLTVFDVECFAEPFHGRLLRIFRAYVAHWNAVRTKRGYQAMVRELRDSHGTSLVFDYLVEEGFAIGLPAKNSTWSSLERRSDVWHEEHNRLWRDLLDQGHDLEDHTWGSLVGSLEIDGCSIVPITSSKALRNEGREMSHCVGGYDEVCANGQYRVFHIDEPDGGRSTLGILIRSDLGVLLDQLQGPHNSSPSDRARKAATQVAEIYERALLTSNADEIRDVA